MSLTAGGWLTSAPIAALAVGWALAGIGMGLCYVDTLNMLFTPPPASGGLTDLDVSGAAVMAESIAGIATMTAATAFLATSFGDDLDIGGRSSVLLTVIAVAVVALAVPLVRLRGQDK